MNTVLDAAAVIAYFRHETGGPVVKGHLDDPNAGCFIHAVNLCEVFYKYSRHTNPATVDAAIAGILRLGVTVVAEMDERFWRQVGRIKIALQSPSLADCFCIALAMRIGATLLTADHPDFEPAARQGLCPVQFIR